ncbi:MAG: metallophosphoesterase, partial [Flavobacteriales bacterium]
EAEPWIEVFNGIKAKKGKFSILGNHDYADYGQLPKEEKLSSRKRLAEIQKEMGFRLLLDENVQLKNGDAQIDLIGVENWGSSFKQKGDIDKALIGADNNRFQILMSHDPSHWDKMIKGNYPINLTLSGHTHGMQFGVEVPALNIKWSPVKFRYKYWDGLYQEGGQYLHVNRGFGFLGFPGRVGMWPEITVLELQNA